MSRLPNLAVIQVLWIERAAIIGGGIPLDVKTLYIIRGRSNHRASRLDEVEWEEVEATCITVIGLDLL